MQTHNNKIKFKRELINLKNNSEVKQLLLYIDFPEKELDNSNKFKLNFDINTAIVASGDNKIYNIMTLISLSLIWVVIPTIPIMLPYFRMTPKYKCYNTSDIDNNLRECIYEELCNDLINKIAVNSQLKTWATDFGLDCDKSIYFGFFGSIYFCGIILGNLIISKFTDSFGRKPVLIVYVSIFIIISIITITAKNYYILFLVMFLTGFIYSGTSLCAYVLNYESSSINQKKKYSTFLSMSYGIGAITHIIIFYYFQDWLVTVFLSTIFSSVMLIFMCFVKESPEFLFMRGKFEALIRNFKYVSKFNGFYNQFEDYLTSLNKNESKKNDKHINYETSNNCKIYGILEILAIKEQRWTLIVVAISSFIMSLSYYAINFSVINFGTDPFATGIMIYFSEASSQFVGMYFNKKYGYRLTISYSYLLSGFNLILIYIFTSILSNSASKPYKIILIFLAKSGTSVVNSSIMLLVAELFPINMRVASMSFCNLAARFGGISGSMVIELFNYSMALLGILCILCYLLIDSNERIKQLDKK